jgi:hypothetical protein
MLNDWFKVYQALEKAGCVFPASHAFFQPCPRNKAGLLVYLDKDGRVEDVDIPGFPLATVLRWNEGNHAPAFPAFNCRAIYDSGGKELWTDGDLKLIERCLHELPGFLTDILEREGGAPPGYPVFRELARRAGRCGAGILYHGVREILTEKQRRSRKPEYARALYAVKTGEQGNKRGKEYKRDIVYLLGIKDWDEPVYGEVRYPPYHQTLQRWMTAVFIGYGNGHQRPTGQLDAYGMEDAGREEKHPAIRGKAGISSIRLFAANEDTPCLERYGMSSTALFPAGYPAREKARQALEYLLDNKRENINWVNLGKYGYPDTVAFAYCPRYNDAAIIRLFSGDGERSQDHQAVGDAATAGVLKVFEGIAESERNGIEVVIGIMEVLDDGGNARVSNSRHYPLGEFIAGARRWQEGCSNIPPVILPKLVENGRAYTGSLPLYPLPAIFLLNGTFRQDGEMTLRRRRHRFTPAAALDLLLEKEERVRDLVQHALTVLVTRVAPILVQARLQAELDYLAPGHRSNYRDCRYVHLLPALLGLLLWKIGVRKERYMTDILFNLGRLLAAADRLHLRYGEIERNGDIPNRLIGNDQMPLALQNPREALVTLGRRLIHPYMVWALRMQKGNRPVGWCIYDITNLSALLAKAAIPEETDATGKAEIILGYLSYGGRSKSKEGEKDEGKEENDHANETC